MQHKIPFLTIGLVTSMLLLPVTANAKQNADNRQYAVFLDDIEEDEGVTQSMPDMVTNLQVTPGEKGAKTATITFNAPTQSINGAPITEKMSAKIFRNDEEIKELTNMEPGSLQTFVDENPVEGFNTYYVIASSASGEGKTCEPVKAYVGMDRPGNPLEARAMDNVTSVEFTWTDSDKGFNGGYVDNTQFSHNIYTVENIYGNITYTKVGESGVGQNSYTLNMRTDEGKQEFKDFGITTVNSMGESNITVAPSIIVGAPYELPFTESFKNGKLDNSMWWSRFNGNSEFTMMTEDSSDGNGCVLYESNNADDYGVMGTGKLTLAGAIHPKLEFTHLAYEDSGAKIVVAIQKPDGTEEELKTIQTVSANGEWIRNTIDIDPKYGELPYLFLQFTVSADRWSSVMLDEISITDQRENDMAVKTIALPASVNKGENVEVKVTVENRGTSEANGYKVNLYADGELQETKVAETALASMEESVFTFTYPTAITMEKNSVQLKAEVEYEGDINQENNSKTTTLTFKISDKQKPESASVTENSDGTYTVTWTSPADARKVITDSFEEYDSWSQDKFGEWTAKYEDKKSKTGNIFTYHYPGEGDPFAFVLVEPLGYWIDSETMANFPCLKPHSGDKYLAAFYSFNDGDYIDANDWLISPALSGYKQTISFWVNNLVSPGVNNLETFDVLYSTMGTDFNDFIKLGSSYDIDSGEWKEIKVDLPEGAKYFAIHRKTREDDAMIFLVDDVTYEKGTETVTGYNVYRNDQLLKTMGSDQTEFIDETAKAGEEYTYAITALYENGESEPIIAIINTTNSIEGIETVLGTKSYTVYTLDGILVGKDMKSLKGLKRGVYIINDRKVIIK